MAEKKPGAPKTHSTIRLSELTQRQLRELQDRLALNRSESMTLAVDRLYHAELSDVESLRDAVTHLKQVIAKLEETSFAAWPQWSGADMEAAERVIAEFGFVE